METTEMFWGIMGALGALAGGATAGFLYLLSRVDKLREDIGRRFDAVEERVNTMSGRLEHAIGSMSAIQRMFEDVMRGVGISLGNSISGNRAGGAAGKPMEAGSADGEARRDPQAASPSDTPA